MLEKSAIVAAHPDDEMLWFSSIVERVDKIVLCLTGSRSKPELGAARKAILANHPLPTLHSLGIDEPDAFGGADWANPVLTDYGLAVPKRAEAEERYQANYRTLFRSLRQELSGCVNVFTHNPWGEYGHEDHVQVYRVIKDLQQELRFRIWYSNYCSNKSYPLMLLQTSGMVLSAPLTLGTNREMAAKLKKLYEYYQCWTWFADWDGCSAESFFSEDVDAVAEQAREGCVFPLNFIRVKVPVEKRSFLQSLLKLNRHTEGTL